MLNLCITLDYELFMGKNLVSEHEVLIEPARKIGNALKASGVSGCFFADVCCPMRYREAGEHRFPDAFDKQLQELALQGHDVQLHIQTNWINAVKIGRDVEFEQNSYRIHNWRKGEADYTPVKEIIHNGAEYLKNLITPINRDYKCIAFRAGGYCLQPEKLLAPILYDEGIRIDSSVCKGFAHDDDGMYYDYKDYPKKNNIYISGEYGLSDEMSDRINNGVLEVPVGGYKHFPKRAIASKLNSAISDEPPRGFIMNPTTPPRHFDILNRIRSIVTATNMLTFDSYNAKAMTYMLSNMAASSHSEDKYIATISHPKMMTDAHIENMIKTIESLKKQGNIRFISMRQIYDEAVM